jgi:hypothetical protein
LKSGLDMKLQFFKSDGTSDLTISKFLASTLSSNFKDPSGVSALCEVTDATNAYITCKNLT